MIDRNCRIGFIGTGLMGAPMAMRLFEAGYQVLAWNRTKARARRLGEAGIPIASSIDVVAEAVDVCIVMVSDGAAVTDVLFAEDRPRFRPGTIVIDMSSIPPGLARDHAAKLGEMGIGHLDAPVSGGTVGAGEGSLAIMVGGTSEVLDRVHAVLSVLGRPVLVGPSGCGQTAKLANQMIVGITIGAVAEALVLCEASGADPGKVKLALAGGFADSRILNLHGQRMLDRNWTPGGLLRTQVKDLHTVREVCRERGLSLPLVEKAAELFDCAMASGSADLDHSALYLEIAGRHDQKRTPLGHQGEEQGPATKCVNGVSASDGPGPSK